MLNTFPHLLALGFYAPTLIRIAVACLLFYAAYKVYKNRGAAADLHFPVVGTAAWAGGFTTLMYLAFGLLLFFGAYTQIAALLCGITSLKGLLFNKRYPLLFPYPRSTYALLLAACLSLLVSGAGAMAYDLPL